MAVLMPFIGRDKSANNIIHAGSVFSSRSSVVSLSEGKDRKIKKQLANCMKEIQQLMKASKTLTKNLE